MRIRLKLFAILKQRAQADEIVLELTDGTTVGQALEEAGRRLPVIVDLLPQTATAVNLAYAPRTTVLRDGDELALIPPVSGG